MPDTCARCVHCTHTHTDIQRPASQISLVTESPLMENHVQWVMSLTPSNSDDLPTSESVLIDQLVQNEPSQSFILSMSPDIIINSWFARSGCFSSWNSPFQFSPMKCTHKDFQSPWIMAQFDEVCLIQIIRKLEPHCANTHSHTLLNTFNDFIDFQLNVWHHHPIPSSLW